MELISLESILPDDLKAKIDNQVMAHIGGRDFDVYYGSVAAKQDRSDKPKPNKILHIVCDFYRISYADILVRGRQEPYVNFRQIAQFLLRKYTDLKLEDIAHLTGLVNHATVIHAIKQVEYKLEDPLFMTEMDQLEQQIIKKLSL